MSQVKEKLIAIIPAYEPPPEFVDYAKEVADYALELVVVNDGSGREYDNVFEKINAINNVKYISYDTNRGKGYALKQAFKYCSEKYDESFVCVTADCDGQHAIEDIIHVAEISMEHPGALVLGSRNFDRPNVPKRSKAGNTSIREIFHLLYGLNIYDTQTGLRGFSVKSAKRFLSIRGNRFEFEMDMLIRAQKHNIHIFEIPIKTIYPDDPKDHVSHYNPIKDSIRIVGTVIRNLNWYILSSALSAVLDVLVFFVLSTFILQKVDPINTLIATVSARVASSVLNFTINRKYVFAGKSRRSIYRYYILWLCQLGASYGLIFLFGNVLGLPMVPMKVAGDLLLSLLSYQIQRHWVFKNKNVNEFYGPFVKFIRRIARAFTKKYRCEVPEPEDPTVYVCRHLNMHGPLTTIIHLDFHVHPMVLNNFFDKNDCYKQYAEFTFTERRGKKKKKHNPLAFIASRIVPSVIKSVRAIPVYRGAESNSMQTLKAAIKHLQNNESVIVYPDIEYTAGYETESELYEGFLLLGLLYKRATGKSLRFVPVYIDESSKTIKEYPHISIDNFREQRTEAYGYIKAAINGRHPQ